MVGKRRSRIEALVSGEEIREGNMANCGGGPDCTDGEGHAFKGQAIPLVLVNCKRVCIRDISLDCERVSVCFCILEG